MTDRPLVSVVIPTKDSSETLEACLKSVNEQNYQSIEVIVVDKFSKDKTIEIAKKYGTKIIVENLGMAAARNRGLKETRGSYILSLDSDMVLTKNVIEECVNLILTDGKIGAVIVPEKSVGNSFLVAVRDFERSFYGGTEMESARFFKKEVVEKVGGYDEAVTFFEDSTLPQKIEKLGYNVKARITSEILHCEGHFSLWNWLKKKFYYGKTAIKYRERFGEYAGKQMSIFYRLSILLKNKRFYSKPLLALGVIILKFLEYFSAELGLLASEMEK